MKGLCVIFLTAVLATTCDAGVLRVNASSSAPAPDGSSWDSAFPSIQSAMTATQPGDEVWVAKGVYLERVTLRADVRLYGGFAGTETERSQRNPAANESILDGQDTNPNLVVAEAGLTTTAVLDGFTIRNALLSGIYLRDTSPLIVGNRIIDNGDDGIDCDRAAPEVLNNVLTGNTDDGIDADFGAPQIRNNEISGNGDDGIQLNSASALVSENTITANFDDGINCESDRPRIIWNYISGNGDDGIDCNLTEANVLNNVISGNGEMGIYCFQSTPLLANNVISGNPENGIRCDSSPARIINNTITANATSAIHAVSSSVNMANNIIAFNGFGVRLVDNSAAIFTNNCVFEEPNRAYAGVPDPTGTNGNIAADPMFVDAATGNYHLQSGSPCADAGSNGASASDWQDIDGDPRRVGAVVDIGADELTTPAGYTLADVAAALRMSAGLTATTTSGFTRYNVVTGGASATVLDVRDVAALVRMVPH